MTETSPPTRYPKNLDMKCLRCGAMNLRENKICGHCGANLPLVYDEQGQIFDWKEAVGYEQVMGLKVPRNARSPQRSAWLMRVGLILFAILMAVFILHRKH